MCLIFLEFFSQDKRKLTAQSKKACFPPGGEEAGLCFFYGIIRRKSDPGNAMLSGFLCHGVGHGIGHALV